MLKIGNIEIKTPIFQGGMAIGVSMAELAAAVSNEGGVGVIAGTGLTKAELKEEIQKAKKKLIGAGKVLGVNIMFATTNFMDLVDATIESGAEFIIFGAGFSRDIFQYVKETGTQAIPIVSSLKLAKIAEKLGAPAVIVEGGNAGGHLGSELDSWDIVPEVCENLSIPVIGAGGVADGAGAAAVFMLGAEAVQVGTRFAVAKESNAHQNFKDKILKAKDIDTVISASVVGHPVRAIKNKLATEYNQAEKDFLAGKKTQEEIEELGAGALRNAVVDGDVEYGSVMAGQIAGLVRKEETCAEILEDLYTGAAKVIKEEAARWADVNV